MQKDLCRVCKAPLPMLKHWQKYCSGGCRQRAFITNKIRDAVDSAVARERAKHKIIIHQ